MGTSTQFSQIKIQRHSSHFAHKEINLFLKKKKEKEKRIRQRTEMGSVTCNPLAPPSTLLLLNPLKIPKFCHSVRYLL